MNKAVAPSKKSAEDAPLHDNSYRADAPTPEP